MKKYFLYELKKSAFTIACLSVICSVIYLISILVIDPEDLGSLLNHLNLGVIASWGGILAFCIPFRQFEYKMKKRSADLFFALPLSHTKILTVKYLVGLIIVFAPYTCAYIIGALAVIIRATHWHISAGYYPLHFIASLIPVYIIYAVSSFAYTRAGKASDGALNAICWATVISVIALVLNLLSRERYTDDYYPFSYSQYIYPAYYLLFAPLSQCTQYFTELITGTSPSAFYYTYETAVTANMAVGFTLTGLMGIGATLGVFFFERKAKFEDIEQISESFFGMRVMLPLFTVCISALCTISIALYIVFAIAMFLITAYYKRTLKIGKKQAIILAVSLVVGLIIGVITFYVL